jgi:hypothetical protein
LPFAQGLRAFFLPFARFLRAFLSFARFLSASFGPRLLRAGRLACPGQRRKADRKAIPDQVILN